MASVLTVRQMDQSSCLNYMLEGSRGAASDEEEKARFSGKISLYYTNAIQTRRRSVVLGVDPKDYYNVATRLVEEKVTVLS